MNEHSGFGQPTGSGYTGSLNDSHQGGRFDSSVYAGSLNKNYRVDPRPETTLPFFNESLAEKRQREVINDQYHTMQRRQRGFGPSFGTMGDEYGNPYGLYDDGGGAGYGGGGYNMIINRHHYHGGMAPAGYRRTGSPEVDLFGILLYSAIGLAIMFSFWAFVVLVGIAIFRRIKRNRSKS